MSLSCAVRKGRGEGIKGNFITCWNVPYLVRSKITAVSDKKIPAFFGDMKNEHIGSSFDNFLTEDNLLEEVTARAIKRVIAWQITQAMKESHLTKAAMAKVMNTSRSQLDRLLDPNNSSLTLGTLASVARVLGKRVEFKLV